MFSKDKLKLIIVEEADSIMEVAEAMLSLLAASDIGGAYTIVKTNRTLFDGNGGVKPGANPRDLRHVIDNELIPALESSVAGSYKVVEMPIGSRTWGYVRA